MEDLRKPVSEMSEVEKEKFRELIHSIPDEWMSKDVLKELFYTGTERGARRKVERFRQEDKIPYISHSKRKGYKIARYLEDYTDAKIMSNEMHSRIKKMLASVEPVDNFCRDCEQGLIQPKSSKENCLWQESV